jgi:hypothetical protein
MTAEQLHGQVVVGPGRFEQVEALGGSAPEGGPVGVIGLVAGVGRLAVLLGREGMDQAGLEAGLAEGELDRTMLFAGAFEGDHEVAQVVLADGLPEAIDGGLEVAALGGQGRGFEQDAAVAVGQEVAGAGLGTVDGDDAKVFGADALDARDKLAVRFLQQEGLAGWGVTGVGERGRRNSFRVERWSWLNPKGSRGKTRVFLFFANPHTTVLSACPKGFSTWTPLEDLRLSTSFSR